MNMILDNLNIQTNQWFIKNSKHFNKEMLNSFDPIEEYKSVYNFDFNASVYSIKNGDNDLYFSMKSDDGNEWLYAFNEEGEALDYFYENIEEHEESILDMIDDKDFEEELKEKFKIINGYDILDIYDTFNNDPEKVIDSFKTTINAAMIEKFAPDYFKSQFGYRSNEILTHLKLEFSNEEDDNNSKKKRSSNDRRK